MSVFFSPSVFCFCGHSAAKLQENQNRNITKASGSLFIHKHWRYFEKLQVFTVTGEFPTVAWKWGRRAAVLCCRVVVCVEMCSGCVGLCSCASASGDVWRVRPAGASTRSNLQNKSSELPDLNRYKNLFPDQTWTRRGKKSSRHWSDCDFKQESPHL